MIFLAIFMPIILGYAIYEVLDFGESGGSDADITPDPMTSSTNTQNDLSDMLDPTSDDTSSRSANSGDDQTTSSPVTTSDLLGDQRDNAITGTDGADTILGRDGDDTLSGGLGADSLNGGNGADILTGGDGNDLLEGRGGNDVADGEAGNDTVIGNDGKDTLSGGTGNDSLNGAIGADVLFGGLGDDALDGQAGEDTLSGEAGNDTLLGGAEDDLLSAGSGNDEARGGDGNDILGGGEGIDLLVAEDGNDTVLGNASRDIISAGDGDDLIIGGDGNDSLEGGAGNDTIIGGGSNFFLTTSGETNWTAEMLAAFQALENSDPALAATGTASQIFASAPFDGVDTSSAATPVIDVAADLLIGGSGDDILYLEDGDTGEGESGLDTFVLNGDGAVNSVMTVSDYAAADDTIIVQYDSSQSTPAVAVADNGPDAEITVDGNIIASVIGAAGVLTTGDVSIVSVNRGAP